MTRYHFPGLTFSSFEQKHTGLGSKKLLYLIQHSILLLHIAVNPKLCTHYPLDLPGSCFVCIHFSQGHKQIFAFSLTTDPNLASNHFSNIIGGRKSVRQSYREAMKCIGEPISCCITYPFSVCLSTFQPSTLPLSQKVLNSVLPHWLDLFSPFFFLLLFLSRRHDNDDVAVVYRAPFLYQFTHRA
jgi:hypothetical protein